MAGEVSVPMLAQIVWRLARPLDRNGLPVNGSRLLLLGMTCKLNTGDIRSSPTMTSARLLAGQSGTEAAVGRLSEADAHFLVARDLSRRKSEAEFDEADDPAE